MRLGILSDSHGRADRVTAALELLDAHDAEQFIHLGDLGSIDVIAAMSGRAVRLVFGNCDWEEKELRNACAFHGLHVEHPIGRLQVDGKTVAYTHGHLPELMDVALAEGVDWLLHGHTHLVRDERIGRTRVINPGALQRARRYTVALLDTDSDALEVFELPTS
jgi:putative phosphoesterase